MVEYQGEKMSKSLGNLVIASRVLEHHSADAFRLYLFSHHYRTAWEYVDYEIEEWGTWFTTCGKHSKHPRIR